MQGTAKTTEGISHPDRDAQFAHLNATATAFLDDSQPVISVDTKAKEWLGNRDRPGRIWRPGKDAIKVDCHTFTTNDQPMAIPYGIYDIANNTGWVNVGTDHDTAQFAVESIRRWWQHRGRTDHPHATRLLITADSGGSNDPRRWTWKSNLAAFARESGLEISVCHLPPGTSKWNKIEHRMFCHITANWRGRPLTSYQVVIETIAATTTKTGLTIGAELDTGSYDLGISVTPAEFHALPITPNAFHGDWNYTLAPLQPRTPETPASTHRINPDLTLMLTDPALTGMSRTAFEHLVAVSEPYWDAMAEAAFQRRFHRPRSYLHPQTSSVDHLHRLLAALLRRRRAVTITFLAQLLGVNRTNLSIQYQDGKRLLDLHQVPITPIPGSAARTFGTATRPSDSHQSPQLTVIQIQAPGRTENCQIGVFAAYATTRGRALVDRELYLPKSWTDDRERCHAARVPDERDFTTENDLARAMVLRALASPLPITWVTADAAYGQDSRFRRFLEDHDLSYVVAVPKSQQVHGPRIEDRILREAPPEAWRRLSAGAGAKGERSYDWAAARLPTVREFDGDEPTRQRWMLARRSITKPDEIAYYLACAPLEATLADLIRIAGCRWKIEECFQSAKNECGLDEYEVRRYVGWYRHITLAMLAHAFLAAMTVQEREKGAPPGTHPTSWTSPRQKSVVCWQLDPAAILHQATTP